MLASPAFAPRAAPAPTRIAPGLRRASPVAPRAGVALARRREDRTGARPEKAATTTTRSAVLPAASLGARRAAAVRGASLVPTAIVEPPASASAAPVDSDAGDFDWHRNWYPVAFEADLSDDAPYTFTLLGEPLVFWKDHTAAAGTNPYRCTADKCPHRLVPLSEGRVNERGEIECGYHGWTFRGDDGKCTSIPQLPAEGPAMDTALASPRSCVTPYHAQVAQGILWVYPVSKMVCGDDVDALPPLPLIPELDDPECVCQDIHRDLPMDYGTLLENVMDVSHVPFTHHNSVGKRENATPVVLEMVGDLEAKGFEGIWREGPRNGKYGSQHTEFAAPSLMRHTLKTEQFTTLTVVYAVPTTPGRCRLMARFPFIFKAALPRIIFKLVPRWWSHLNQNAILEDDQIFLHKQERQIEIEQNVKNKSYAQACYMPTKADTYVGAFRKWIVEMAGGHPAWPAGMENQLPPQENSREILLDRFNAHTASCKSCSVALRNITMIRKVLRVASIVALALAATAFARLGAASPKLSIGLAVVAAAMAGVREWLGGVVGKMRVGPYPPPRRPPSMMESALEQARIALI